MNWPRETGAAVGVTTRGRVTRFLRRASALAVHTKKAPGGSCHRRPMYFNQMPNRNTGERGAQCETQPNTTPSKMTTSPNG